MSNVGSVGRVVDWVLGCLGIRASRSKYAPVKQGCTQFWYGRVNRWAVSKDTLKKELDLMAKKGLSGYLIEMSGWGSYKNKQWTDKWVSEVKSWYTWLLTECRSRKLWLFVSIVNDNMGKGKYGDTGPSLEKAYSCAQKLAKVVKAGGKDGVYVQPVAETQSASGKKFEQYCIKQLAGFKLVYNGSAGHPKKAIAGMQNYATHPSSISASNPKDAFVVSDHGKIIRELNIGGGLENHGDPSKVRAWAKKVKSQGCPVCAYYAFKVKDYDAGTIKALAEAIK